MARESNEKKPEFPSRLDRGPDAIPTPPQPSDTAELRERLQGPGLVQGGEDELEVRRRQVEAERVRELEARIQELEEEGKSELANQVRRNLQELQGQPPEPPEPPEPPDDLGSPFTTEDLARLSRVEIPEGDQEEGREGRRETGVEARLTRIEALIRELLKRLPDERKDVVAKFQ